MLAGLSAYQLSEWMAYFEVEPWGEERADVRSGLICSVLANLNRDNARNPRPYSALDFMPYVHHTQDGNITEQEIERRINAFMAKVNHGKKPH